MNHRLTMPLTKEEAEKLQAGDLVSISGIIYTARDAAHIWKYTEAKFFTPT